MKENNAIMLSMKIMFDQEGNTYPSRNHGNNYVTTDLEKSRLKKAQCFLLDLPRRCIPYDTSEHVARSSNIVGVVFYPNDEQHAEVQQEKNKMGKYSKRNKIDKFKQV